MEQIGGKKRFLLASIIPQRTTEDMLLKDLGELKELVEAFGGEVVDLLVQKREVHDRGMYLGKGKLAQASELITEKKIDIVVLNALVKPGQLFDIKESFRKVNPAISVWDRVDLILEIFSQHAQTSEAKLQIEIAAMRHMGPRIYGMGLVLSRQAGGIGSRGVGETNTELMQRHWRDQMKKRNDKLQKLVDERERQMQRRQKVGLKTVSIIGYTNAGKTSLFNSLTHKKKLVKNALFATLDSTVGRVYFPALSQEILVSDTIGFIKNLPTNLIDAFSSTLMESIHADIILHVIDITDTEYEKKIHIVENILHDLGIYGKKKIYVFNKCENTTPYVKELLSQAYSQFTPQFISAKNDLGIPDLLMQIEKTFTQEKPVKMHVD